MGKRKEAAGWEKVRYNAAGLIRLEIGSRLEEGSIFLTKEELYTVLLAPSRIDNKIRHIDIKIQELEFMLYPSGIRYDKNNVQASPSDKMGDVMAEIGDLMTLRDNLGAQMPKAMLEVEAVLNDLPRDEYNVMYFKYIGCIPTWEEVARKVNFTERHVFRIKKKAIAHLCDKMS